MVDCDDVVECCDSVRVELVVGVVIDAAVDSTSGLDVSGLDVVVVSVGSAVGDIISANLRRFVGGSSND